MDKSLGRTEWGQQEHKEIKTADGKQRLKNGTEKQNKNTFALCFVELISFLVVIVYFSLDTLNLLHRFVGKNTD